MTGRRVVCRLLLLLLLPEDYGGGGQDARCLVKVVRRRGKGKAAIIQPERVDDDGKGIASPAGG